ncbi:RNA polymerase I-specific transcription initiation factor rrn3 [Termitomyces sp. J132]|nr:RNA polymerase I-specific transcription initiation factor rrn3 [Termitomyces sp. J132]
MTHQKIPAEPKRPTRPQKSDSCSSLVRRPIATNSRVKQDEKYKKDMYLSFVNNALQQKTIGESEPFDELVNQFNPNTTFSDGASQLPQLRLWLLALSHVVSRLERTHAGLVYAVVNMPWTMLDSATVKSYTEFIGMLISARPEYLSLVLEKIAQGFTYQYGLKALDTCIPEGSSRPLTRRVIYDRLHYMLQHLLSLVPTLPSTLQPFLVRNFPHKRQKEVTHITYIRNLLRVSFYCPELADKILATIVDRAIQIDVEIQVELEELDEQEAGQEVVFELDPFDTVLDSILTLIFDHFHQQPAADSPERRRDILRTQFHTLLAIFDRTILRTFKSRYTQFLLFWYTSLDPEFADIFQGMLVERALLESSTDGFSHISTPIVTRAAAASYIGSFVSRATFVDREDTRRVVGVLCEFLKAHLDRVEEIMREGGTGAEIGGMAQHTVFYAVAQTVFLIFCFRWRDLLEDEEGDDEFLIGRKTEGGTRWIPQLGVLQRVVTSILNPLRVCSANVVAQFARIAHATDFLYCYTILETNKRSEYVPNNTATADRAKQGLALELNTFFPFDPYRLPKSHTYIQGLKDWNRVDYTYHGQSRVVQMILALENRWEQ